MPANRTHNEWFRPVRRGGRKSCPCCHERLDPGESVWTWGEYFRLQWNTVTDFCSKCFVSRVQADLLKHVGECGCTVKLPAWLTLNVACKRDAA